MKTTTSIPPFQAEPGLAPPGKTRKEGLGVVVVKSAQKQNTRQSTIRTTKQGCRR